MTTFYCPRCGQANEIESPIYIPGIEIVCPNCRAVFDVVLERIYVIDGKVTLPEPPKG